MSKKVVGVIHAIILLFLIFYAFLFKKSRFDYVYLIVEYCIYWSWTFHNGQCPVSYYYAKWIDQKTSKEIEEIIDSEDILLLFGKKHRQLVLHIVQACAVMLIYSMFIVFRRNNMNGFFGVLPLPVYYLLSYLKDRIVNLIFSFIFFFYIAYLLHKFVIFFRKK